MIHKHQALFVFADFLLSVCMLFITVLALSGHFNKVIEVKSCNIPVVVASPSPSVEPSASSSATPSTSPTSLLKKLVPVVTATPTATPVKVSE